MGAQQTFASMAWTAKGKVTRRERFLAEMDAVIPWTRLLAVIKPHYPKAGPGRQPLGGGTIMGDCFLAPWLNLSEPRARRSTLVRAAAGRFVREAVVTR